MWNYEFDTFISIQSWKFFFNFLSKILKNVQKNLIIMKLQENFELSSFLLKF